MPDPGGAASQPFVIALDGPAASGKSTVGQQLADRLGFFYLDTGVLYRAVTWLALARGVAPHDAAGLARLARGARLAVGPPSVPDGRQLDVWADGQAVSQVIRAPEVDAHVSAVSAHAAVREALRAHQRAAIRPPGTILAGRDIGTVIVPEAPLKVWLTADPEERARRRSAQTGERIADVLAAMRARDRFDGTRAVAPMARAADAVELDTDRLSVEEVVDRLEALVRERLAHRASAHPRAAPAPPA